MIGMEVIDIILAISIGIVGLIIGSVIQWMNMKDDIKWEAFLGNERTKRQLESLREQFKALSVEANNISHNPDYSDSAREYHTTAAEIWNRAAQCADYKLEDLES